MIPVDQTICNFKNGNCFQACVASIFEVELNDIPNFMEEGGENFSKKLTEWGDSKGLIIFDINTDGDWKEIYKDMYVIANGPSPRDPSKFHSTISYNGVMVHDPHPDKTGLFGKEEFITIFALKEYKI